MSKNANIDERVAVVEALWPTDYYKPVGKLTEEFWNAMGKVTISINEADAGGYQSSVSFKSEDIPVTVLATFDGDCCSSSEIIPVSGKSISNVKVINVTESDGGEVEDSSGYGVIATGNYTVNLEGGEVFEFKEQNTSNGYYGTVASMRLIKE